jgi:DNA-binding NarL/FixJ family response regulator
MKILAVDGHPLICEGLARVVTKLGPDVEVIQANSVGAALNHLASNADVSLILIELRLADEDRLERVRAARPEVPVVVFSALADHPATVRALIGAGVKGVLSNRCPPRVLVEALRLVLVGGVYVPPEALGTVRAPRPGPTVGAGSAARQAPRRIEEFGLTSRQAEVLALMAQGKPNKLISRSLKLAEGTVKTHASAIYQALGVSNRTEAVFAVSRLGIQLPFASSPPGPASCRFMRT